MVYYVHIITLFAHALNGLSYIYLSFKVCLELFYFIYSLNSFSLAGDNL